MTSQIKVILAGNPGRGKSTIGNALLCAPVFEEGTAPDAVTTQVTYAERTLDGGTQIIVYDTPGLHETNARNFHRNAACLAQAVEDRATLPAVVVFVASAPRVSTEDVAAFRSIFRCMSINPAAILVVVNKVETDESDFAVGFERTFRAAVAAGELGLRVDATRFVSVPDMPRGSRAQRLPEMVSRLVLPTLKHAGRVTMLRAIVSEEEELEQRKRQLEARRLAEAERMRREREEECRRQREAEELMQRRAEQQRRDEREERDRLRREAQEQAAEAERLHRLRREQEQRERERREEELRRRQQPMVVVHGPHGPMLVPLQHVMGGGMFHPGLGGHFMHPGFGGGFY